jgi:hypothetical protein
MLTKRLLRPERLRRVPAQFSWIDQRLVRAGYIERCDAHALALYLFLLTVADARGLSYYADRTLLRLLSMPAQRLHQARAALMDVGLIAYQRPLYQVLSLEAPPAPRHSGLEPIGALLSRLQARRP